MHNPFRYFDSSPEVIRLTMMLHIRYPLSLRQIDDLLFERSISGTALARCSQPRSGHAAFIIDCMDASRNARTEIGVLGQADCSFVSGLFAQTLRPAGPDGICRSTPHFLCGV